MEPKPDPSVVETAVEPELSAGPSSIISSSSASAGRVVMEGADDEEAAIAPNVGAAVVAEAGLVASTLAGSEDLTGSAGLKAP